MVESTPALKHLNKLNTTINKLVSIEIKFDDEIYTLILSASLPNSWVPMRATITNSIGNVKLIFRDDRDNIFAEGVHRRDSREFSTSNYVLNVENTCRNFEKNSNKSNNKEWRMVEVSPGLESMWNVGTIARKVT